jgi:Trk K+ transport system NAD-binding subunit
MIGGQTIARIVLEDYVTILLELPDGDIVVMKRVTIDRPGSIGDYLRRTGVRIIGIEGPGRSIVAPRTDVVLLTGDEVIAVGDTEQLKKFIHQL